MVFIIMEGKTSSPTVTGNSGDNFYQELKDLSFILAPPFSFEFLILSIQNLLISSTKLGY